MLSYLIEHIDLFGPFRLFSYVTFKAGGAALTSFLIVVLLGDYTAKQLKRLKLSAGNRFEGYKGMEKTDIEKVGTPCMGGILIILAVVISSLLWNDVSNPTTLALLFVTISLSLVGFSDDYIKVFKKNKGGLSERAKLILQTVIAALAVFYLSSQNEYAEHMRDLMVPFIKEPVYTTFWCLPFSVIVIVGAANSVNLTDGKDGLASGCMIFSSLTYAVFAYLMGNKIFSGHLNIPFIPGTSEAMIFATALCGACIGFLWHNCHPASMFMGDTGSLALGGAIGMLAVIVRQEILLLLVGFIFVIETVSVIMQRTSLRLTGKRIFRCTPIHHHFEMLGWSESKIVVRFWIIAGLCALLALSTLKLR